MKLTILQGGDQLTAHFPEVRALFERCVDRAVKGEFSADDLWRLALQERMHIAIARDGERLVMACAFEFLQFPRMLALNIAAMAGQRLGEVVGEFWPAFRQFARQAGADCIQASCHPGMARILGRYGFGKVYQVMRSAL